MRDITIVFIRHSKSCSNLLGDSSLKDPDLTAEGVASARRYGPRLAALLKKRGINYKSEDVVVGSSGLLRAKHTAELLFPGKTLAVFPFIRKDRPAAPRSFPALMRHLYELPQSAFIIVAHKGFMRKNVMDGIGFSRLDEVGNLDAMLVRGAVQKTGGVRDAVLKNISWRADRRRTRKRADKCINRGTRRRAGRH